jgi:FAD/FMN-containing dehydrogenase
MAASYASWGRYPLGEARKIIPISWATDALPPDRPLLAYGLGRSYGDSCLNTAGTLLDVSALVHIRLFDKERGILRAEAGVSLAEILKLIVPYGWFLPVSPGTKFVTLGGAVANDIHGKNHHAEGTFGRHVRCFELLRSTGERQTCSATEAPELFGATIGGLGLTGLITWVEIQLKKIETPWIRMQAIRFHSLEEFFSLSEAAKDIPYTAAWLDTTARGAAFGRGVFMRGDHARHTEVGEKIPSSGSGMKMRVPFDAPSWLLNRFTIRAFNTAYYHAPMHRANQHIVSYEPFFYPLDAVGDWNRLYGRRGFLQYQCVIPSVCALEGIRQLLETGLSNGLASFLSVLKMFGSLPSPGLLSFPRAGATLAMDVPYEGSKTLQALTHLDEIVRALDGRLYPAKDARMSAQDFQHMYPEWKTFSTYIDPAFSSSFWRRVTSS